MAKQGKRANAAAEDDGRTSGELLIDAVRGRDLARLEAFIAGGAPAATVTSRRAA